MLFIFEFFAVTFLIMSIFMGAGLLLLAYFGLAPMPIWMKEYITRPKVTWINSDVRSSSPAVWSTPAYSVGLTLATIIIGYVGSSSIEMRHSFRERETRDVQNFQRAIPSSSNFLME